MLWMAKRSASISTIVGLAERIQNDIRQRRLGPGDAYPSTSETARTLGVSTQAANRALQLLVKRHVLVRSQGRGTYVAEPRSKRASGIQCVHLLVRQDYLRAEGLLADGTVLGLQGELPGAQIQFNFLPRSGEETFAEELIAQAMQAPHPEGFVLVRGSLEAQRLLALSGLPAVVHGTLYPSVDGLAMVDRDNRQVGRILAEHLLAEGCRRVLLLLRQRMLPGDALALDAALGAFARAGLGLDDLSIQHVPNDTAAARVVVREWMETDGNASGVICRNIVFADAAAEAARDLGRAPQRGVTIAVADYYHKAGERPRYPCAYAALTPEEQGQHIGRLLAKQAWGGVDGMDVELIPVRFEHPAEEEEPA